MDVRIYIGPHRTASRHIFETLQQNQTLLKENGVEIIEEKAHRKLMMSLGKADEDAVKTGQVLQDFIDANYDGRLPKTLVIFDHKIAGTVTRPIGGSFVYPAISSWIKKHERLFVGYRRSYFMATRCFPDFLTSCYSESLTNAKVESFDEFIEDLSLKDLRWSDTFARILRNVDDIEPYDIGLVTWKFEDYPQIWRQVVQLLTGLENGQDLDGRSEASNVGLSLYGAQLMHRFLVENPPKEPGDFKKVHARFMKKFPSNLAVAEDAPFWSEPDLQDLRDRYEDDLYYIQRMERVAFIPAPPKI